MKIDIVLSACTVNTRYVDNYEKIKKTWENKFNARFILILISENQTLPEKLQQYKDDIVIFYIHNINPIFVAQCIRVLYPALFDNKNVLITDMDIIPVNINYFNKDLEKYSDEHFITYTNRYMNQKMFAICYNLANSSTWSKLFNINSYQDIEKTLISWYDTNYNGTKNCPGWYTDQLKLFETIIGYNKLVIFQDSDRNYNRLDKKHRKFAIQNTKLVYENVINNIYSDYHFIKNSDNIHNKIMQLITK